MSLESSDLDVEKSAAEAYDRWHLGTQLSALAIPAITLYSIFHYCSQDWQILAIGIVMTAYTLFSFIVLPGIIGKAMSDRVFQNAKTDEAPALILTSVQPDPPIGP